MWLAKCQLCVLARDNSNVESVVDRHRRRPAAVLRFGVAGGATFLASVEGDRGSGRPDRGDGRRAETEAADGGPPVGNGSGRARNTNHWRVGGSGRRGQKTSVISVRAT